MDQCCICGKQMENLPFREKEGVKAGEYSEMCSESCLEQWQSFQHPEYKEEG